jgi:hypothetical protein
MSCIFLEDWKTIYSRVIKGENRLRVLANRLLRRIFRRKRREGTRGWEKLHIGQVYNLFHLPDIIRMIKSGKMRQVGMWNALGGWKYVVNFGWEVSTTRKTWE